MNYKYELKKYKKHRKKYLPVVAKLLDMHTALHDDDFPVTIADTNVMLVILELLDIGYLDPDALIIKKKFESIAGLIYNGKYPLTKKGDVFLHYQRSSPGLNFFKAFFYSLKRIVKRILNYFNLFRKNTPIK